jgi:hypothetical protein
VEDRDITDIAMNAMVYAVVFAAAIVGLGPFFQRILASSPMTLAQSYQGLTDSRTLNATPTLQWLNLISDPPYSPWISASFFNDGPNSVFIGINNPDELTEINKGGSLEVNMSGGQRRIEFVFYKCNPGQTASVRVVGKY